MKIISSMGAGGKLDPTHLKVVDISKTYNCPFAQFIRIRLRKLGIDRGRKSGIFAGSGDQGFFNVYRWQ